MTDYALARSLRTLSSSTGRSGIAIRKVAPDAEILPKPFRATMLDEAVRDALATS